MKFSDIPSNVCLETESRPECFKHYFIKILLLIKAPPNAFQIHTKAKLHEVAVTTFFEPSCNPVTLKTTSTFAASGEPKAVCAPLSKHLRLLQSGQSPPWLDRVRKHPRSPVNHQLQRICSTKCCPTASSSRIFSVFFSYEMSDLLFGKQSDFLSIAQI